MLVPVKFSADELELLLLKGGFKVNDKPIYKDIRIKTGDEIKITKFKNLLLYCPVQDKSLGWEEQYDINWKQLEKRDKRAKKRNSLVGRYIRELYADGHAIYQTVRVNKKTARIHVCTGLGDD